MRQILYAGLMALLLALATTEVSAQTAGTTKLGVTVIELDDVIKGWSAKRDLMGQSVYNDKDENRQGGGPHHYARTLRSLRNRQHGWLSGHRGTRRRNPYCAIPNDWRSVDAARRNQRADTHNASLLVRARQIG
jgi:hypothetical protein